MKKRLIASLGSLILICFVFFLLYFFPFEAKEHPFFKGDSFGQTLIIAHHGGGGEAPEETQVDLTMRSGKGKICWNAMCILLNMVI